MIQFSNQPIPYENTKEENLRADKRRTLSQVVAATPVFLGSTFLFFWVLHYSVDFMAEKNIADWVSSCIGLGNHSFLNTSYTIVAVCLFMLVLLIILMFSSIRFIADRITYIKDCAPLDADDCAVAVKFFKKHPEYKYFLEEVRRQGRKMLSGELKALQGDVQEQMEKRKCKELYQGPEQILTP